MRLGVFWYSNGLVARCETEQDWAAWSHTSFSAKAGSPWTRGTAWIWQMIRPGRLTHSLPKAETE
eukprot:5799052-Pyramimonas_sp.AAC.1